MQAAIRTAATTHDVQYKADLQNQAAIDDEDEKKTFRRMLVVSIAVDHRSCEKIQKIAEANDDPGDSQNSTKKCAESTLSIAI